MPAVTHEPPEPRVERRITVGPSILSLPAVLTMLDSLRHAIRRVCRLQLLTWSEF